MTEADLGHGQPMHEAEVALLAELGAALAAEIEPGHVDSAINAFWTARTDALVAELVEELTASAMAGARGGDGTRQLSFRAGTATIRLTVDTVGRRVHGEVAAEDLRGASWLDRDGRALPLALDGRGRFDVVAPRSPSCVEMELGGGHRIRTPWTLI